MEDKRTRSDYIREIKRLERLNNYFEKSHKELIKFIEDEIDDIERRMDFIRVSDNTNGGYTAMMYLAQQKNALIKVSKKIFELERC